MLLQLRFLITKVYPNLGDRFDDVVRPVGKLILTALLDLMWVRL